MSLLSSIRSGYGRSRTEEPPVRRPVVAMTVPVETESEGVRAHRLAGETDSVVAEVAVLLSEARRAPLDVTKADQQLGSARANLAKARLKIQNRETSDACAWAQTALNQAVLARELVNGLMTKRQTLATRCQELGQRLSELRPQVSSALDLGRSVRASLFQEKKPAHEWRAFRWLDQAAESRVKQAEALLDQLGSQLGRGQLDEIEWDAERAKAWIDQTVGYLATLVALEDFLAINSEHLADKATTAHTLMTDVFAVFRDGAALEDMNLADEASNAYAGAKGAGDTKAHTEVLDKSLAVVLAIESRLLETVARRFDQRQARNERDLVGWTAIEFGGKAYAELARADHARMLVDLFPRQLSPDEQQRRSESYHGDGSPCSC